MSRYMWILAALIAIILGTQYYIPCRTAPPPPHDRGSNARRAWFSRFSPAPARGVSVAAERWILPPPWNRKIKPQL
jgi:hypothetical protein